jgi:hypothetical protein
MPAKYNPNAIFSYVLKDDMTEDRGYTCQFCYRPLVLGDWQILQSQIEAVQSDTEKLVMLAGAGLVSVTAPVDKDRLGDELTLSELRELCEFVVSINVGGHEEKK